MTPSDGHHGLRLSIVRAIATAHNATLLAEARREGGLAVKIRFPLRGTVGDPDVMAGERHESLVVKSKTRAGVVTTSRGWRSPGSPRPDDRGDRAR
jgi:hypothetical protein